MASDDIVLTRRTRTLFNSDWSFKRDNDLSTRESLSYEAIRDALLPCSRYLRGADAQVRLPTETTTPPPLPKYAHPDYDARDFEPVDLPHDYAIGGPFSIDLPGETGKLPWAGVAFYIKRFTVEPLRAEERLILEIDGAMSYSTFWLNGKMLGGWPYGYTSFKLDLTEHLVSSGENVLAVRLDNPENSSRWYPGAGLYRNVWLTRLHAIHVAHDGLFVHTPRVTEDAAVINVDIVLENELDSDVEVKVETTLFERDPNTGGKTGERLTFEAPNCVIPARSCTQRTVCATLKNPKIWDLAERHRYIVTTTLSLDGVEIDQVEVPFGIRSIAIDAEHGFLLNGKHVPLKGVCLHHDSGALGTAFSLRALQRKLEILQAMGCNSIRTSHNPPEPELLELCDDMGLLVMVEAFDCWRRGKKSPEGVKEGEPGFRYSDYARVFDDWHEPDLRAMVRKSRNHPSVILYSIGNEVLEQWYADGWPIATQLAGIVREEDRTRPITVGCNGEVAAYRGFQTAVDAIGFNYKPQAYPVLRERNPTLPLLATETASTVSTRGEYFFPVTDDRAHGQVDFQVSSYDLSTPPWAFTPDDEWRGLDAAPYVAGEYVWTGFDYLGEPTPYNSDSTNLLNYSSQEEREKHRAELERLGRIRVPSRSSYFGILDLAGFPKDRYYAYQARWRPELRMAYILPHWNWPERVGEVTPVHVYSAAEEAELFLNGRSQGVRRREPGQYRFRWDEVVYEPGELLVKTTKDGKPWAIAHRETTGLACALRLEADRRLLDANGSDLSFLTVSVVDERGRVVPRTRPLIRCQVEGEGEFVAMDNGDPTSLVAFSNRERAAHQGLLLVIVRTKRDCVGTLRVTVTSPGLGEASIGLECR